MKGIRKAKYASYEQKVRKLTKENARKYPDAIHTPHDEGHLDTDEEFRQWAHGKDVLKKELDHRMPIVLCFECGLAVEIAASPPNLQWIRGKKNREKSRTADITIHELLEAYDKWLNGGLLSQQT